MNDELLKRLIDKASIPSVIGGLGDSYTRLDTKLFARLIVLECARIDSETNNVDHVDGQDYNWTILDHFKVEP